MLRITTDLLIIEWIATTNVLDQNVEKHDFEQNSLLTYQIKS